MARSDLHVKVIKDMAGLLKLAPEWRILADSCPTATIFQTAEWNTVWWRHFGSAFGRSPRALEFREGNTSGRLVGFAPLMTSFWFGTPLRRLSFLGTGTNDYNDLIAAPGFEAPVVQAFYAFLEDMPGWQVADFQQLRAGGLLRENPPPAGSRLAHLDVPLEACPYISLPAKWPEFLAQLGKKTRFNIGYHERSLRKIYDVEIGPVSAPDELDDAMSCLFELHQRRWNERWLPGVFSGGRVRRFHRDAARALLERSWLRLFTLSLDGETQAALYCFSYNDRICYYQGGFEPTLARFSPGTVLTAHAIQQAVSEHLPVFDFLRGDEGYKAKWATVSHVNYRRLMTLGRTPLTWLVRGVQRVEETVEHRVKEWVKNKTAKKPNAGDT